MRVSGDDDGAQVDDRCQHQESNMLDPWAGLAVFGSYAVAVVAAAAWRLKRSEA